MYRAISTHVFLRQRLHAGLLEALARSGAEAVELFAARQHFDYTSRTELNELAVWFRENPLKPWSLHAPLFPDLEMGRSGVPSVNVVHVEKSRRIDAMDEIKRALETAEQIPFSYLILHLGDREDAWSPRTLEHAITAVEHLRAFAAPLGVKILLENLQGLVAQPENIAEVLSGGHFHDVGVCLDLGHAHLGEGISEAIGILGTHIRSVHVHDNAGDRDSHLWPGDGTIAWPQTTQALARLPHGPAHVLEIHYNLATSTEAVVQDAQETFAWLTDFADAAASEA
ncbi:MAG TPA: sugar phosphate isomerase/epimerase family protein [Acidobacteriaceae bacterium]|jgi:sugar phosphate isomerase/epimerase|nr:sugar phosphate isomerase/epimerase family protein [Acidobacteriaceae bacterium]